MDRTILSPNLENSDWLRFYSQTFDYVEIDSTFYRIPNEFMVKNWAKRTPDNFRIRAKFPKVITHDKQLVDVEDDVDLFLNNMELLQQKSLALLIQLSPSIEIMHGLYGLRNQTKHLANNNIGYFGASTGAAARLKCRQQNGLI